MPSSVSDRKRFDCDSNSPCNKTLPTLPIDPDLFYYPAVDNNQFVQCDEHGGCFLMDCADGTKWSQDDLTCVQDTRGEYLILVVRLRLFCVSFSRIFRHKRFRVCGQKPPADKSPGFWSTRTNAPTFNLGEDKSHVFWAR